MGTLLGRKVYQPVPGRIMFSCPGCKTAHEITVDGSRGWTWNGDGNKPTVSPSILAKATRWLTDAEYARAMAGEQIEPELQVCHSFIREGRWDFLGDCSHALAGQTVDIPDWPHGGDY
jgi:hypothetical protein